MLIRIRILFRITDVHGTNNKLPATVHRSHFCAVFAADKVNFNELTYFLWFLLTFQKKTKLFSLTALLRISSFFYKFVFYTFVFYTLIFIISFFIRSFFIHYFFIRSFFICSIFIQFIFYTVHF